MATTSARQQTHQSVLPQRTALELTPADNPGAGTKRGSSAGNTASGADHGRGERNRSIRRSGCRHEGKAAARPSGKTGSDPGTPQQSIERPMPRNLRVFVLDKHHKPLMPCHPARARELLRKGRARVHKLHPFTIRLIDRTLTESEVGGLTLKIDPGSKATGMAVVREDHEGAIHGLYGIEIQHRGQQIQRRMQARAAFRRIRRSRNTRYRAPRFSNRSRPEGWLPPSLRHRVEGTRTWVDRLLRLAPVTGIRMELVRFDLQREENPEISGIEYQQGTLAGYEVREYLLEKWGRACAYCDATGTPLNAEHIRPKARGGSNRVSNLTLACIPCNQAKGALDVREFVTDPARLERIAQQAKTPLQDAAAVNTTRWALRRTLSGTGLSVETGSGGQTKWNRTRFGLPKSHVLDAVCVGRVTEVISYPGQVLIAKATGRGGYARTQPDKYGFPRLYMTRRKRHFGFQTGDHVRAVVPDGKKAGVHTGRAAVRTSGSFNITTPAGTVQGINQKRCTLLSRADGWAYSYREEKKRQRRVVPDRRADFPGLQDVLSTASQ